MIRTRSEPTPMKHIQSRLELLILVLILYSVVTLFAELEFADADQSTGFFLWSERLVAVAFTVEYVVRWVASRRLSYPLRPMAIVDLLAILPFYLGFLVDLRTLRLVRVLRVLRLFKLYRYTNALQSIRNAFNRVRYEFGVIGFAVLTLLLGCSVAVYELERAAQPVVFARVSDAVWYSVTTITTVGYGDKVPVTTGGKLVAVFMMVGGLGLFGTFVSLLGSAFLEELRRAVRQPGASAPPAEGPGTPEGMPDGFDPRRVLKSIDEGAFGGDRGPCHAEGVRLLAVACRLLAALPAPRDGPGYPP